MNMPKNEKSSPKVLKVASKALRGKQITRKEIKALAGSVLTQGADQKKK